MAAPAKTDMPAQTAPGTGPSRIGWMDALRGLSILLVVFDHSLYFALRTVPGAPEPLILASQALNPVRMPAMVFLSGLLLSASLRKGPVACLEGKVRRILWPYLLWAVIHVSIWLAADPFTDTHHTPWEYVEILYAPPSHLWFLYDLFLFYVLALALQRIPGGVLAVAALALSVVAAPWPALQRFLFLYAFFCLGDLAMRHSGRWEVMRRSTPWLAGAAVLTLALGPAALLPDPLRYQWQSVPMVLGALLLLSLLGEVLCRTPLSDILRHMGRNSLPVYILHWLVISVLATLAGMLGWGAWMGGAGLLALLFTAGVAGSLAAAWLIGRLHLGWLLVLPRPSGLRARSIQPERAGGV